MKETKIAEDLMVKVHEKLNGEKKEYSREDRLADNTFLVSEENGESIITALSYQQLSDTLSEVLTENRNRILFKIVED